jgi:UDPglucose--hexose-1-phosphate uridylyltransferase
VSEFRKDPITGQWVIVAENRLARPNEYASMAAPPGSEDCPFCEGREERTPPEIEAVRRPGTGADQPGWTVRTIPNKFPTVARTASRIPATGEIEELSALPGTGVHEVIIQSPRHEPLMPFLPLDHRKSIVRTFRSRVRALSAEPQIQSVLLFENAGPESGGTLYHPHSQVVALPLVPPVLEEEVSGAERWGRSHNGACAWESIGTIEQSVRSRMVWEDRELLAFTPWASHFPFEMMILPRRHAASMSDATDAELDRLAEALSGLLRAFLKVEPHASYNYFLHNAPIPASNAEGFHWHWHLAPRVIRPDGFELGDGISVNPVSPESAAEAIRNALGT